MSWLSSSVNKITGQSSGGLLTAAALAAGGYGIYSALGAAGAGAGASAAGAAAGGSAASSWLTPAVSNIAGGLISGGLGLYGSQQQASANTDMSRENMAFQDAQAKRSMYFSHAEATRQMDFQEEMSSTAYQRAMIDAKKAGFNPIIAASGSASSPSGASGSGSSGSGAQMSVPDTINTGLATAMSFKRMMADLKIADKTAKNLDEQNDLLRSQRNNIDASSVKTQFEKASVEEDIKTKRLNREVTKAGLPGILAEGKIDQTKFGQAMRLMNRMSSALGGAASSAKKVGEAAYH